MNRLLTVSLLTVITVVTVMVLTGVGQGSPPKAFPITAAAVHRELTAVAAGGSEVTRGEALFSAHGCNACHTMAAGGYDGRLGPRLDIQSQGDPVNVVEGNIIDPPDDDVGYEKGLMPENFAKRLSKSDLLALATYIHAAASAAAGSQGSGSS
jgi:mono/diheme cytochrome c family protein